MTWVLIAFDVASAIAMLAVAGSFFALWRASRAPLHLVFATAFGTLAVGISTVTTSEFDLTGANPGVDAVRIVAHTAAPLMLALGYWSVRREKRARPARIVSLSFVVAGGFAALLYLAPPGGSIAVGSTRNAFLAAHSLQLVLYITIAIFSMRSLLRNPSLRLSLIPLAFGAYAFSKYTWILIDLSDDSWLVGFVLFWRFTMLALMLTAVISAFLRGGRPAPA